MRLFAYAILAATAFAGTPTFAQDAGVLTGKTYVTGGYDHLQSGKLNTGTLSGRVGYALTPNFAIEGEGGLGVQDDRLSGIDYRTRGKLGAFAVASAPVAERISLIARAGYVQTWGQTTAAGVKTRSDDGSFAVGAGAQYMLDDVNGLRLDYTRYTKDKGRDGIASSYVRKF